MEELGGNAFKKSRTGTRVLLTDTNRWATPARIAIGLANLGCCVSAVCPTKGHPILATKAIDRAFPYSSFQPLRSLANAIAEFDPHIVIPCDDRAVEHLHELYSAATAHTRDGSKLTKLIEYSLGPESSFRIASSRWELLRIASEEGVRVPDFQMIDKEQDLEAWKREHAFPWVLKGQGTFGGRGVRITDTIDSAKTCFREINGMYSATRALKRAIVNRDPFWLRPWWSNRKPAVIVQSYIVGRPANCAVFAWNGRILAGISVEVLSSDGPTGPAQVVRVIENSEMMFSAQRIAERLGLNGFFGLDFMIEESSNAVYLIEMNPRCTPLTHLRLGKGRDLLEAISAQLAGRLPVDQPPITDNSLIAYFPQAWNPENALLSCSFQDIPHDEPDLVDSLLKPWPSGSLLFRFANKLGRPRSTTKSYGPAES